MINRLRIAFRHKQLYLDNNTAFPIVVVCGLDGMANYVAGVVDQTDWKDFTEYTEGLDELNISWSAITAETADSSNGSSDTGSNYDKGVSDTLRFSGPAYDFIHGWLLSNPCQILNSVEARIYDQDCGKAFRIFELKTDNIEERPEDEPCIYSMAIREADPVFHVFQKTIIEDNWQNWFNQYGTSTKDHPTFPYIVEKKPKLFLSIYVVLVYLIGIIGSVAFSLVPGIVAEFRKWIHRVFSIYYFCPAPLVRTYIQNVCAKYGFTFNTIFDDVPANKYRDVCLFYPVSAHYRDFRNVPSPSSKYIWANRTVLSMTVFLNQLKKVFNAEWYITPNSELVFQHISYFQTLAPLYDFSVPGADKYYSLVYKFNGKKKAAYGDYQYQIDPQDTSSNEVKWRYNDIVDFDGPANNPMLEGHVSKSFDFAMTAFHNDGSSKDYLQEGIEDGRAIAVVLCLLGLGQLFLSSNPLTVLVVAALLAVGYAVVNDYVNNFFNSEELNGYVRTASSEVNVPRLLLWDRGTPLNRAKVVSVVDPAPSLFYHSGTTNYYDDHPAHDDATYFGDVAHRRVWNYPMYVEALYTGNLFDNFHEVDNPIHNPLSNRDFELKLDLCCEWLDRLGAWEGDYARIGNVLILKDGRKARIMDIKVDYKTMEITITGNVLK